MVVAAQAKQFTKKGFALMAWLPLLPFQPLDKILCCYSSLSIRSAYGGKVDCSGAGSKELEVTPDCRAT